MRPGVNAEACGVSCRGRCYSTSGRGTSGSVLLLKLPSACPSTVLTHRGLSSALSAQHLAGLAHNGDKGALRSWLGEQGRYNGGGVCEVGGQKEVSDFDSQY